MESEPDGVEQALLQIQALYAVEQTIRDQNLTGEAKQLHRLTHSKPKLEIFFDWIERQLERQGFTPTHPFIKALVYAKTRRLGLEVFVTDPDVPIDTNHLERALRVIPMGRNYPRASIMHGFAALRRTREHADAVQTIVAPALASARSTSCASTYSSAGHNYRPSRNCKMRSGGRYRMGTVLGG